MKLENQRIDLNDHYIVPQTCIIPAFARHCPGETNHRGTRRFGDFRDSQLDFILFLHV